MPAAMSRILGAIALTTSLLLAPSTSWASEDEVYRVTVIAGKAFTKAEWETAEKTAKANRQACDEGDMRACKRLGDAYAYGEGANEITEIAEVLYRQACEGNVAEACEALGNHLFVPGGRWDVDEIIGSYEKACNLGVLSSCARLAEILSGGVFSEPDKPRALQVAEAACDGGGQDACRFLADQLLTADPAERDFERAMALLDQTCRAGDQASCDQAALELEQQPNRDEWRVGEYRYLSCLAGSGSACTDAGKRLYDGVGFSQDRELAFTLFDQACAIDSWKCEGAEAARKTPALSEACSSGDGIACAGLGQALTTSESPLADFARGRELLVRACLDGLDDFCGDAARSYTFAMDWQDRTQTDLGLDLLEKGCAAGDMESCSELAEHLEEGTLVGQDEERAIRLYLNACKGGHNLACHRVEKYAGIDPDVPLAVADELYLEPIYPEDPPSFERELLKRVNAGGSECVDFEEVFRGVLYEAEVCPLAPATTGGFRVKPGSAPWQALIWRPQQLGGASLGSAERVLCGGSLIAKGWILTAAHCIDDETGPIKTAGHRVRLGVKDPSANEGISYPILETHKHRRFTTSDYAFDIALIRYDYAKGRRLGKTDKIALIRPDPLAIGKRTIKSGDRVYAYGWGWTAWEGEGTTTTDYLQGVRMNLRSEPSCTTYTGFKDRLRKNAVLCARGNKNQQTCRGDSGGPLVTYEDASRRPVLLGVVSAGVKCGTTGKPGRYPRIAKVREWIASHVPEAFE